MPDEIGDNSAFFLAHFAAFAVHSSNCPVSNINWFEINGQVNNYKEIQLTTILKGGCDKLKEIDEILCSVPCNLIFCACDARKTEFETKIKKGGKQSYECHFKLREENSCSALAY